MGGLEPVFEKKLGFCIAEPGGMDEVANAASEWAETLAEVEAGGLHLAGLRFEVAPIWSLIQFWNDA
jgi:hypothetical protein